MVKRQNPLNITGIVIPGNAVDPVDLLGPDDPAGRDIQVPSACLRYFLGLPEQGLAFLQGLLHVPAFGDILDHPGHEHRLAPIVQPGLCLHPDPPDAAVRSPDPAFEIQERARENRFIELCQHPFPVLRKNMVEEHREGPAGVTLFVPEDPVVTLRLPGLAGLEVQFPHAEFTRFLNKVQALFDLPGRLFCIVSARLVSHVTVTLSGLKVMESDHGISLL